MIFAVTNTEIMEQMKVALHNQNELKSWTALFILSAMCLGLLVVFQIIFKFFETRRALMALHKLELYLDVALRHGKLTDEKAHEIALSVDSAKKSARKMEETVNKIPIIAIKRDEAGEPTIPVVQAPAIVVDGAARPS